MAQVSRNLRIRVDYQDVAGKCISEEFEGYFSELLQHEIDHLNGTLFIDHIEKPETITMTSEWDKHLASGANQ
jgi:peptide deformylase